MQKLLVTPVALLFSIFFLSTSCLAFGPTEMEVRKSIDADAAKLWKAQDYSALDTLATNFMVKRERTPSGLWKAGYLSAALKDEVDYDVDDKTWAILMEKYVLPWPKVAPKSAFAHLQVAGALLNRAWKKRGHGWAREVPPEAWKDFNRYLDQARTYLEATKSVSSVEMTWYQLMIDIGTWQRWDEKRLQALLREAMTRDREYFPMYFSAIQYYSPAWGGSAAKIEAIASQIADSFPPLQGDAVYVRMYWWAADAHFKRQLVDSNVDCPRMIRGMRAIAAEYPDLWNINRFASFSIDCRDKVSARKYFEQIGDKPELDAWGGSMRNFLQFRAIANSTD